MNRPSGNGPSGLRAALLLTLFAPVLTGCGLSGTPTADTSQTAGTLLLAPLQQVVEGRRLQLRATPTVHKCTAAAASCQNLLVTVRLWPMKLPAKPKQAAVAVPPLKVKRVYLVTEGGVWQAAPRPQDVYTRADRAAMSAVVRGQADLPPNQAVQVVAELVGERGHVYLLRDKVARVRLATQ